MDQLRAAVNLNRDAVGALSMLGVGRVETAINTFQRSLKILQRLSDGHYELVGAGHATQHPIFHTTAGRIPGLENDLFFIYNQPKLFGPSSGEDNISLDYLSYYVAVVVFNTALSHHRKALETGTTSAYRTAHWFYQHAKRLFTVLLSGHTENTELVILRMAVMNNMAQVEYEFHTYERFKVTMQEGVRPIMQDLTQRCHYLHFADDEVFNINEISRNVLMVTPPVMAGAA
jgi:hypothetical protein